MKTLTGEIHLLFREQRRGVVMHHGESYKFSEGNLLRLRFDDLQLGQRVHFTSGGALLGGPRVRRIFPHEDPHDAG